MDTNHEGERFSSDRIRIEPHTGVRFRGGPHHPRIPGQRCPTGGRDPSSPSASGSVNHLRHRVDHLFTVCPGPAASASSVPEPPCGMVRLDSRVMSSSSLVRPVGDRPALNEIRTNRAVGLPGLRSVRTTRQVPPPQRQGDLDRPETRDDRLLEEVARSGAGRSTARGLRPPPAPAGIQVGGGCVTRSRPVLGAGRGPAAADPNPLNLSNPARDRYSERVVDAVTAGRALVGARPLGKKPRKGVAGLSERLPRRLNSPSGRLNSSSVVSAPRRPGVKSSGRE